MDDAEVVEVVHGGEDVLHPQARDGEGHRRLLLEQAVHVDESPLHDEHCPRARRASESQRAVARRAAVFEADGLKT